MTAAAIDSSPPRRGSPEADLSRHEKLTVAAGRVRVRSGANLPVDKILLGAASLLFPLGLAFILLGWDGAAHTGRTYAQIDYLISGGLLGLGLSVAGGFMYFGYWLSRQLSESRRQSALTLRALGRLEDLLDASLNSAVDPLATPEGPSVERAPVGPTNGARPSESADGRSTVRRTPASRKRAAETPTGPLPVVAPVLLATPRGSLLHRPDCPVVARRTDLRRVAAGTAGFGYCTMCDAAGVRA